jgi:hypothetical protein
MLGVAFVPFAFLLFVFVVLLKGGQRKAYAVLAVLAVLVLLCLACNLQDLSEGDANIASDIEQNRKARLACMSRPNSEWIKDPTTDAGGYCRPKD